MKTGTRSGITALAPLYGLAAAVVAVDQGIKALVVAKLAGEPPVELLGGAVELVYTTNSGGAFSLLTGAPVFFAVMAIVVIAGIVYASRHARSLILQVALGLLLGGAVGNLADRIFRGDALLRGEVVDYLKVPYWPVFNLADSCIVVGGIGLALLLGRGDRDREQKGEPDGAAGTASEEPSEPADRAP